MQSSVIWTGKIARKIFLCQDLTPASMSSSVIDERFCKDPVAYMVSICGNYCYIKRQVLGFPPDNLESFIKVWSQFFLNVDLHLHFQLIADRYSTVTCFASYFFDCTNFPHISITNMIEVVEIRNFWYNVVYECYVLLLYDDMYTEIASTRRDRCDHIRYTLQ